MEICLLKTCCGVFSLRTGSLIILWINLIVGLSLALSPTFSNLFDSGHVGDGNSSMPVYRSVNDYKKTTTQAPTKIDWQEFSDEFSLNPRAVEVIRTWSPPTGWVITITSAWAIYGVIKAKPLFILPFILSSIFLTFLLAVVEIAVSTRQFLFCTFAYLLLHSEIFIYFILVLYSHFRLIAGYVQNV